MDILLNTKEIISQYDTRKIWDMLKKYYKKEKNKEVNLNRFTSQI